MPTECSVKPMGFARVDGRAVVADFDGGAITSNAGGLLLGATDRAIGLVERFAACFIGRPGGGAGGSRGGDAGRAAGARHCPWLRGLARPRPAAPRPGARGGAWPAGGAARPVRAARGKEHAQPARAWRRRGRPLPPDRPRRPGDRVFSCSPAGCRPIRSISSCTHPRCSAAELVPRGVEQRERLPRRRPRSSCIKLREPHGKDLAKLDLAPRIFADESCAPRLRRTDWNDHPPSVL